MHRDTRPRNKQLTISMQVLPQSQSRISAPSNLCNLSRSYITSSTVDRCTTRSFQVQEFLPLTNTGCHRSPSRGRAGSRAVVQASCAHASRAGDNNPHWAAGGAVTGMSANSMTNGNAVCGGSQREFQRMNSSSCATTT